MHEKLFSSRTGVYTRKREERKRKDDLCELQTDRESSLMNCQISKTAELPPNQSKH